MTRDLDPFRRSRDEALVSLAPPAPAPEAVMARVAEALRARGLVANTEAGIHDAVYLRLLRCGLRVEREVVLGPGARIDLVVSLENCAVGVEIKRGRPRAAQVRAQLARYAATGRLDAIVLVVGRRLYLPRLALPATQVSVAAAYGVAV